MSQQVCNVKTYTAGEALGIYRRVKLSASSGTEVEYADQGDWFLGVTQENAADAAMVSVLDKKAPGTAICTADGAISAGADVYGADDGKVSATVSGIAIGKALEASLADGDQIEVYLDDSISETWS